MKRIHVVVRVAALAALGAVGCSSAYWVLYLGLPVLAALLVSRDGAAGYLDGDAPAAIRVLRWVASAYAYLWLLTDVLPTTERAGPVELSIQAGGTPTVGSALGRLLTSIPAALVLVLMSVAATVLWIFGAIAILATERVPPAIADFIAMTLRYQFRLLAYHLSVVQDYPVVTDASQPHAPHAGAT